jgi:DNA-binding beta-propeller fold protein YncE
VSFRHWFPTVVLAIVFTGVLLAGSTAQAQVAVLGTLPDVPYGPSDVVADTSRGLLYVLVAGDGGPTPDDEPQPSVEVYNMDGGAKVDSIDLEFTPEYGTLAPGAEQLIVRHFGDGCFSIVDLVDRTVEKFCLNDGLPIQALVSDARPDTAWLLFGGVSSPSTAVVQIDPGTAAFEDIDFLARTQPIAEGAVTPNGLTAVVPLPSEPEVDGKVALFGLTGDISDTTVHELTVNRFPLHAVVTADGKKAYVANGAPDDLDRSTVSVVDIQTAAVVPEDEVLAAAGPWRIALFDQDKRLAVVCLQDLVVQLFDLTGPGLPVEDHRIAMPGLSAGLSDAPVVLDENGIMLVLEGAMDRISVVDIDPQSGGYGSVDTLDLESEGHPARIAVDGNRGRAWVASSPGREVTVLSIPKSITVLKSSFESGNLVGWRVYPPPP